MDHETGRSRGTGFVCFWEKEDADEAIEEAEAMAKELGMDKPAVCVSTYSIIAELTISFHRLVALKSITLSACHFSPPIHRLR
jgi:RNA recognition motif-containing protein